MTRTILQYLVEVVVKLDDKSIARLVTAFLFNEMHKLKQEEKTLEEQSPNHQADFLTEKYNYYKDVALSHSAESHIDYEDNNKRNF